MLECPTCHQSVDSQALECPYCRTVLKAYGHPGMTLHRAVGSEPLCLTCTYHADDTCNFPKRPEAKDCTLYRDRTQPVAQPPISYPRSFQISAWFRRNLAWLVLVGLVLVSLFIALMR